MPETGFAYRLAYLRWLRNRGRVKPETDGEVADWLGVGVKWLGKWKGRDKAPEGRTEARAVESAIASMGATLDWLYDGEGAPPRPKLWNEWNEGAGLPPGVKKRRRPITTGEAEKLTGRKPKTG